MTPAPDEHTQPLHPTSSHLPRQSIYWRSARRRWTHHRHRVARRDRAGQRSDDGSVVEAVLLVPVLMVVLLVVVQFALWAHAAQVVGVAASEGDRAARSVGGGTPVGVARARSVLVSSGGDPVASAVTADVLPGGQVGIAVTGRAESILPWLSLPVSSEVVGPIQEFRTSG